MVERRDTASRRFLPCLGAVAVLLLIAAPATAASITVSPDACRMVSRYVEPPGVEYQPGVDVHGNAVAPADLPGSATVTPPTQFHINITVDLAQRFGIPPSALYDPQAVVGVVEVDGNHLTFNGQPLNDDQMQGLAPLCPQTEPKQP